MSRPDPVLAPPLPDSTQLALEASVFVASLLDPEAARLVAAADPLIFTKQGWRVAHAALRELVGRAAPVSSLALTVELERRGDVAEAARGVGPLADAGLVPALDALADDAPVPALVPQYLADLYGKARERRGRVLAHGLGQNGAGSVAAWEAGAAELRALQYGPTAGPAWALLDAADPWADVATPRMCVETLLPETGVAWLAARPKEGKSLFAWYVCLALACGRPLIAGRFRVRVPSAPPPMGFVSNEDGAGRLQVRRADILAAWPDARPSPGLLHVLARPGLDLFDAVAVRRLRDLCRGEGLRLVVLDTFESLTRTATGPPEDWQRRATHTIADLAASTGALVWVLDHTRKRAADAGPLSLDEITGATAKAAVTDAFLVMGRTRDPGRLELIAGSKDDDGRRFLLDVSPRESGEEKFRWAGSVDDLADRQRAKGDGQGRAIATHETHVSRPKQLEPAVPSAPEATDADESLDSAEPSVDPRPGQQAIFDACLTTARALGAILPPDLAVRWVRPARRARSGRTTRFSDGHIVLTLNANSDASQLREAIFHELAHARDLAADPTMSRIELERRAATFAEFAMAPAVGA